MNTSTKQNKISTNHLESFDIKTPHFRFTNDEIVMINKNIQTHYPSHIAEFANAARKLMSLTQEAATPKMFYEATHKNTQGYGVGTLREVLYVRGDENMAEGEFLSAVISTERIDRERVAALRDKKEDAIIPDGVANLILILQSVIESSGPSSDSKSLSNTRIRTIGLNFTEFAKNFLEFLIQFSNSAVVYNVHINTEGTPVFFVELGHTGNTTHQLLVLFELEWLPVAE